VKERQGRTGKRCINIFLVGEAIKCLTYQKFPV